MKWRVVWPALEVERPLRLPGRVQRQVIRPAVERQRLLLQEQVEVVRGELVAEEVLDLRRLLDLPLVAVQVVERLVAPPLGAEDLAFGLLDLDGQDLRLVVPLVQAAQPAGVGLVQARGRCCRSRRSC